MKITGFADFRSDRSATVRLASRATADLLWYLDSVVGPGGASEAEDPEYAAFRDWFGQRAHEVSIGLISNILGSIDVDRGLVSFAGYTPPETPEFDRLEARLRVLCEEIPSLQDRYQQLFPDEVDPMLEDVNAAILLDLSTSEGRLEGTRLLGELEKWYAFAQQGMRLFRNDADERARFDEYLEGLLEEAEAARASVDQVAQTGEGTREQRAEARARVKRQKAAVEAEILEAQEHVSTLRRELEGLLAQMDRLG